MCEKNASTKKVLFARPKIPQNIPFSIPEYFLKFEQTNVVYWRWNWKGFNQEI
jgi:hypothetical protein